MKLIKVVQDNIQWYWLINHLGYAIHKLCVHFVTAET